MDRLNRHGLSCLVVLASVLSLSAAARRGEAQPPDDSSAQGAWTRPELIVLGALRANPATAPYAISTSWDKGAVVLSGRVGTKAIHDVAVRMVIDLGYPIRDNLVIDTGEAQRVALSRAALVPWTAGPWGTTAGSAPYMVYPPPLFGRVDDPLFGLEPPLVSFPPWARARAIEDRVRMGGGGGATAGFPGAPLGQPGLGAPAGGVPRAPAAGGEPVKGKLQLTVDMAGQVFLTGTVASEKDRQIIEEEARNVPGVSRVYSNLKVAKPTSDVSSPPPSASPPPPPQPYVKPKVEPKPEEPAPPPQPQSRPQPAIQPQPQPKASISPPQPTRLVAARDTKKLTHRVTESLLRRPALAALPITVQSRDDAVTLAGAVPSAYEAMLAYRTVEQTPGVREVIDKLQFQLPDENHPNPLKDKARPEDLEPYLVSQIRRHVGETAHIDVVRVRGDVIEIRGTVADPQDKDRVGAILRSMPLLRDFRLEPTLYSE